MDDKAKPGALLLAIGKSDGEKGKERPAKPEPDDDDVSDREAMQDAAKSMMGASRRGDAAAFSDALDAYLLARGR